MTIVLRCPDDVESFTGCFEPASWDATDCAGCSLSKEEHVDEADEEEFERQTDESLIDVPMEVEANG